MYVIRKKMPLLDPACMGLSLVKVSRHFCLPSSFHSFVRLAPPSILPPRPHISMAVAPSGGQGRPVFGPHAPAARSVLDGREHDRTLVQVRDPIHANPSIKKSARIAIKNRDHAHMLITAGVSVADGNRLLVSSSN
jgi:hypothetical protein